MPKRIPRWVRSRTPDQWIRIGALYIVVVVTFSALVTSIAALSTAQTNAENSAERARVNRTNQVAACQELFEPLRVATVAALDQSLAAIYAQVAQSKKIDPEKLKAAFGPNVKELIHDENVRRTDAIATLKKIRAPLLAAKSCAERYPPLPGT